MDSTPYIPISIGELMDKWVILQIKALNIHDETKLEHIMTELETLNDIASPYLYHTDKIVSAEIKTLVQLLTEVNEKLWDIEDDIRNLERKDIPVGMMSRMREGDHAEGETFLDCIRFIELAREVYITNDKRCAVKRRINELLLSGFLEEKSYTEY